MASSSHILIVTSPYYKQISDMLVLGAVGELKKNAATYDVMETTGALEIAQVIKYAKGQYLAYVALGCVIRGETSHYDIVSQESARALTHLSLEHDMCIGNGILTVDNIEQALVRADHRQKNKGGDAAKAALSLMALKGKFKM